MILKPLGAGLVLACISPLSIGVAGIALNILARDWRGVVLSVLVLGFGMVLADGGRYLMRRAEEQYLSLQRSA